MEKNIIYPNELTNRQRRIRKGNCFVILPPGENTEEIYATIKRAVAACNLKCNRAVKTNSSSPVLNSTLTSINSAHYLIVDISGLNPNVLYELGIAHTLRPANRVIILKDSETACPSDIKHIRCLSYSKDDYPKLYDCIVKFIKNNDSSDYLRDLFSFFNLIQKNKSDEIISDVKRYLIENSLALVKLLKNAREELPEDEVNFLLKNIYERILLFAENDNYYLKHFYLNLLLNLLPRLVRRFDITESLALYFKDYKIQEHTFFLEVQSSLAAMLLQLKYYPAVFEWIKIYFMKGSEETDIIKYKLQMALLNSNLPETAVFLFENLEENLDNLTDNGVFPLVEHLLNLCRDKGISAAVKIAIKYAESTPNENIFNSAVDLVSKLGTAEDIYKVLKIAKTRDAFINQSDLLKSHVKNAYSKYNELKST